MASRKVFSLMKRELKHLQHGCENVTQTVNLRCLKLLRPFSFAFKIEKCSLIFPVLNLKNDLNNCILVQRKKYLKNRFLVFTSFIQRKTRKFHVVVGETMATKCTKSVLHVQSCCFAFLMFSLPLP